jgi:Bacterial PH domain
MGVEPSDKQMLMTIIFAFPFILAIGILAFAPRECTIVGNDLRVKTRIGTLKYDLTEMRGALPVSPEDIRFGKTIRLFGAGWPLKPYGYFSNAKLGRFLAFVTDWQKMVLIVFPTKRLLVSPDNPKIILDRFAV